MAVCQQSRRCSKPILTPCPLSSLRVVLSLLSDAVPEELAEPLYRDQYNQEHLKPPVACLLQSAELYCRAGSLILRSDAVKPLLGHNAVIQALAQKGLYVTDQDRLVTERDLTNTPIHMVSGHAKYTTENILDFLSVLHFMFSLILIFFFFIHVLILCINVNVHMFP